MNAILMCAYDTNAAQRELTMQTLNSAIAQDIPCEIYLVDNGSTFEPLVGTVVPGMRGEILRHPKNESPVKIANDYLETLFDKGAEHILCIPNDVILPSNLYSEFLRWPRGVVTASMTPDPHFPLFSNSKVVSENTPLCVAMYRKWAYESLVAKDGFFFDEEFFMYASDCDLALRLSACGIRGVQLDLQYYHFGSASHKLAAPDEAIAANRQAELDRAYFERKWGFKVADPYYGQAAADINFRG